MFDINTGRGEIWMHSGKTAQPEELWTAIKNSGFTPLKIEMGEEVFNGP